MIVDTPFYLDVTLCCGQAFRWTKLDNWWYGVAGDHAFKVRQLGNLVEFENIDWQFVQNYFSLDVDLQKISASINRDQHIQKALKEYFGLRIIRQDPWECLISYICATYKNIPAIRHMLNNISQKFGQETSLDGHKFYTFPKPKELAKATEKELTACGLGYRAKYVLATSKQIHEGNFNLDDLAQVPYLEAKQTLMQLPGVGAKAQPGIDIAA